MDDVMVETEQIKWERTNDIKGYVPTFPMPCRYCGTELQMRFSIIYEDLSFLIKYKCPTCGWFAGFEIDGDKEYHKEIFEKRGKVHTITPTVEELSEDEGIKKQLTALGYFGGRE